MSKYKETEERQPTKNQEKEKEKEQILLFIDKINKKIKENRSEARKAAQILTEMMDLDTIDSERKVAK